MDKEQHKLQALIDLGLLTRVACHEINNLVASQQGFLRILQRSAIDDPSRARWQEQLLAVSSELAGLVRSLQSRAHSATHAGAFVPEWEADSAIHRLAGQALAAGASVDAVELRRMVGLVASLAGLDEPSLPECARIGTLPARAETGETLFGLLADPQRALAISFTTRDAQGAIDALRTAADSILPTANANSLAWQCALLAALLRQDSADLVIEHHTDQSARMHLLIPSES